MWALWPRCPDPNRHGSKLSRPEGWFDPRQTMAEKRPSKHHLPLSFLEQMCLPLGCKAQLPRKDTCARTSPAAGARLSRVNVVEGQTQAC